MVALGLGIEQVAAPSGAERSGWVVVVGQRSTGDEVGDRVAEFGVAVAKWRLVVSKNRATSGMAGNELVAVARTAASFGNWHRVGVGGVGAK